MTWREVGTAGSASALAHLRHDLANMLLPLTLAADTLAGTAAGLPGLLKPLLDQSALLDLLLDPPAPSGRETGRFVCELVGADLPGREAVDSLFLIDPVSFRQACSPFGKPAIGSTGDCLDLVFPADDRWKSAAGLAVPATPYGIRSVRLDLSVLGAVTARHGAACEVDAATGAVRVTLSGTSGAPAGKLGG